MQHDIDAAAFGPAGEHMAHAVSTCVHCGFCLPACPTYRELGEEMDSPRGRIVLMKGALEGQLSLDDVQPHIDRCLGCLACITACPSGVPYGELLTPFRAHAARKQGATLLARLQRDMLLETLPYPRALRLGAAPGPSDALDRAAPAGVDARDAVAGAALGAAGAAAAGADAGRRGPPRPRRAAGRVRAAGARAQHRRRRDPRAVAVRRRGDRAAGAGLLRRAGAATSAISERARQRARVNIAAFPDDVDAVVTTAAGCGFGMQEYPHLFEGAADAAAATALARRTVDVSAFIEQTRRDAGARAGPSRSPSRTTTPVTCGMRSGSSPNRARSSAGSATCGSSRSRMPTAAARPAPITSISRRWRMRSASARRRRCSPPARPSSPAATSAA